MAGSAPSGTERRLASRRVAMAGAVCSLVLVCFGQWALVCRGVSLLPLASYGVGLGLFVLLQSPYEPVLSPLRPAGDGDRPLARGWLFATPLAVAVGAGATVWFTSWGRSERAGHLDVVLAWLLSLSALVVAATPVGWTHSVEPALRRVRRARPAAWLPAAAVFVVAALARFVALGSFPAMEMDGMSLTLVAREATQGKLGDPFSTAWFGNPTMYAFLQSGAMRVLGETMTGARFISAAAGTLTVVAAYFWSRRHFGGAVALTTAALLALLPMHIYFSRVSLNLVEDSLSLVLVLWLLDRAFTERRALDAVLAGIALGMAQYFYFSARFLVLLAAVLTCVAVGWWWHRLGTWRDGVRAALTPAAWLWAAAALTALPLMAHFVEHPYTFNSRGRQVSVFGPWLADQRAASGDSSVAIVASQLGDAALLPFATPTSGQYRPKPPLVGWPLSIPVALGLAVVTARAWRRRYTGIALAWWGTLAAVGLTIGLHAQRWVLATPLIALCAALGLDRTRRMAVHRLGVPARVATSALVAVVLSSMAWSAHFVFRDANTLSVWSDPNSQVAERLALSLADQPAGTVVYTAFAPRMSYTSHSGVPFLAPQVTGIDVLSPMTADTDVPPLATRTVFAFLPERGNELDVVRAVHPGGVLDEFRGRDGAVMLLLYTIDT